MAARRSGVKPNRGERSTEISGTSCRGLSMICSSDHTTAISTVAKKSLLSSAAQGMFRAASAAVKAFRRLRGERIRITKSSGVQRRRPSPPETA